MSAARPFRRLESQFLRPYRLTLLFVLGGMLLQAALALPIPVVQGRLLDLLVAGNSTQAATQMLWIALAVTAGCLVSRAVLGWWVGVVMTRVSLEVVRELTSSLHRKLQRLPLAFFDRQQTGGLLARLTSDVGTLMIFLNTGTLQLMTDLVLAAGIAGVLMWLHWPLALVALAAVPVLAAGQVGFAGPLRARSNETRSRFAALCALLSERLPATRVVRAFNQEAAELNRLDDALTAHTEAARSGQRVAGWQSATAVLVGGVGTAVVVIAGAAEVAGGALSAGELLTLYALTVQLHGPIVRLIQFQSGAAATRVAIERMIELLDEVEPVMAPVPSAPAIGTIELKDVTFQYRPDGRPDLADICLRANPGQTIGVIGPSGSGKSTLLAVAARLYEANGVRLNGADVQTWPKDDLRRSITLVPQRPVLFTGTVRSNLTYAVPDAPEPRLWEVLETVELAGAIRAMPAGLDTPLGPNGFGLSGGQRQRLALARALLTDPAVFLFDDCTSALDAETEARVQANLAALLPGKTRIVVSHKPSALRYADEVLVLNGGRIVERGTHGQLIQSGGMYASL